MRSYFLANDRVSVALDAAGSLREIYYPLPGGPSHSLGRPARLGFGLRGLVLWLDRDFRATSLPLGADLVARQHFRHESFPLQIRIATWIDDDRDLLARLIEIEGPPGEEIVLGTHLDLAIDGHDFGDGVRAENAGILHHKGRVSMHQVFVGPGDEGGWTLGRRDLEGGVCASWERRDLDGNPCAVGAGESLLGRRLRLDADGRAEAQWQLSFSEDPRRHRLEPATAWRAPAAHRPSRHHLNATPPDGLPEDLSQAFACSLAHLSAFFASSSGAVIASPDSSGLELGREHYGYVWPRDAALSALSLMELGLDDRAEALLAFLARHREPEGYFLQRLNADGSFASSWHPTPSDERLLPIQSDETALVVLASAEALLRGGSDFHFDDLLSPAADFLLRYRDEKTGLPLPSHDLWEERHGIHCYSVMTTVVALEKAAQAAASRATPRPDWAEASDRMRAALRRHLFHEELGRYARRAEPREDGSLHLDMTVDAALASLFLFEEEADPAAEVLATMQAVEEALLFGTEVRGVARYQDDAYHRRSRRPDLVPGNPWLICSLWLARWWIRRKRLDEALALIRSTLALAVDSGALPEQVHPLTGRSVSVQPLAWSHAEMLSTLLAFASAQRGE